MRMRARSRTIRRLQDLSLALLAAGVIGSAGACAPADSQEPSAEAAAAVVTTPPLMKPKSLGRGPDAMDSWRTPPEAGATTSGASARALAFQASSTGGLVAHEPLTVEAGRTVTILAGEPGCLGWGWSLELPGGTSVDLRSVADVELLEEDGIQAELFTLEGLAAGDYELHITVPGTALPPAPHILISGEAGPRVAAYLDSHERRKGKSANLVGKLDFGEDAPDTGAAIDTFQVEVVRPDGATVTLAATAQTDGTWSAPVTFSMAGELAARITATGHDGASRPFRRTVLLPFTVISPTVVLDGTATATVLDDETLEIQLGIRSGTKDSRRYFVHAEVWGMSSSGQSAPVAWVGRMAEVGPNSTTATVRVHAGWLAMAGAPSLLVLKNVTIAGSSAVQSPHATIGDITLAVPTLPAGSYAPPPPVPTPEMFEGVADDWNMPDLPPVNHRIVLMHGMCGKPGNFPTEHFEGPVGSLPQAIQFDYKDVNPAAPVEYAVENDELAERLLAFVQHHGINSMAIVSNSQGGLAAAHLKTFYSSPLDKGALHPGRLIQTVGTPWYGSELADWVFALKVGAFLSGTGKLLYGAAKGAYGCQSNPPKDLRTADAAQNVGLYKQGAGAELTTLSTSHPDGQKCNAASGLVLWGQDDGAVRRDSAKLPGSNYLGHVKGECHTTGMSYPSQTKNHGRNIDWGCAAARPDGEPWWCNYEEPECPPTGCGTTIGGPCAEVGSNTPASFHPFYAGNHPDGNGGEDLYCLDVNNDEGDAELVCVRTLIWQNHYEPRCQMCQPGVQMYPGCKCDPGDIGETCGNGLTCLPSTGYEEDGWSSHLTGRCWPANDLPPWECEGSCYSQYGQYGYCDNETATCVNDNP